MRHDLLDQFSDSQVVTTAAAVSTNSKYKKEATQDLGTGGADMGLVFVPRTNGVGAVSWTIELIEADDGPLTTNVVSLATMSIPIANMKVGKQFFLPLPPGVMSKNYYGARYTPVGGSGQTLTIDAFFGSQNDVANYKSFKSSYNVDN